jgi:hypothetical protein
MNIPTIPLSMIIKLSMFGFLWSQSVNASKILSKLIPYIHIRNWIVNTLVFIIIHYIDVIYDLRKKNRKGKLNE